MKSKDSDLEIAYKCLKYSIIYSLVPVCYIFGLAFFGNFVERNSPQITNQTQLEEIVKFERKRMQIPQSYKIVSVLTNNEACVSSSKRITNNSYEILLVKPRARESTVQHELRHIKEGDCDRTIDKSLTSGIRYLFWEEPRNIYYQFKDRNVRYSDGK